MASPSLAGALVLVALPVTLLVAASYPLVVGALAVATLAIYLGGRLLSRALARSGLSRLPTDVRVRVQTGDGGSGDGVAWALTVALVEKGSH